MKDNIKDRTRSKKTTPAAYMTEGTTPAPKPERKGSMKKKQNHPVTYHLDPKLHAKLKVESALTGKHIYEIIDEALREHLDYYEYDDE